MEKKRECILHIVIQVVIAILLCKCVELASVYIASPRRVLALSVLALLFVMGYAVSYGYLYHRGKISVELMLLLIFTSGVLIKLVYISNTSIYVRSDDVYTIMDTGHMGYIYSLFSEGHFPGNPVDGWEFGQPPLHHIIASIWMRLVSKLGVSIDSACEYIQILTVVYASAIPVVVDRIYLELSEDARGRLITAISTTFFPYLTVMSGDINNDALLTLLMIVTIWMVLRWYKESSLGNIAWVALFFSLSMATKYSAALLVPPIASVFIYNFFKKKNYLKYVVQYITFLLIAIPISFAWPVSLRLIYGTPFGFVQASSPEEAQYIGGFSIADRLFSIQNKLNHSYIVWDNKSPDCDYNIFINLIKTSCFGEQDFITRNVLINVIGDVLMWLMIVAATLVIIQFFRWIVSGENSAIIRIFFGIIIVLIGLSAVVRTLTERMAFICNSNVRFIVVSVMMLLMTNGVMYKSRGRGGRLLIRICACGIALLSTTMWMMCIMYQ